MNDATAERPNRDVRGLEKNLDAGWLRVIDVRDDLPRFGQRGRRSGSLIACLTL
jgi:hypothetical protein